MKKGQFYIVLATLFFCSLTAFSQGDTAQNDTLRKFIQKKRDYNRTYGYGYRIQLYNGFETEAKKIRARFRIRYPNVSTYLVYNSPEWKIQVGDYKTRLEADKALLNLKNRFRGAIVIPLGK